MTAADAIVTGRALGVRVVSVALLLVTAAGCRCGTDEPRHNVGAQCELASDCAAPLVCRLGLCRNECATSRDCFARQRCVLDPDGLGACTVPDEQMCALDTDCPGTLVCRSARCVNECAPLADGVAGPSRDCPAGAVCTPVDESWVCVESERAECTFDRECGGRPHVCRDGRCREECHADRDCRQGWRCAVRPDARIGFCVAPGDDAGLWWVDAGPAVDGSVSSMDGAVPDGAALDGAALDGATLDGATLDGAALDGAALDGAALDGAALDGGPPLCSGSPLTGVTDLTVGGIHACARRGSGATAEVLCWGRFGNIGDPGGRVASPCPVSVPALAGQDLVDIDAGGAHTCAVLATGAVLCWGAGSSGELGRGPVDPLLDHPPAPAMLPGGVVAAGVVADYANTCIWQTGGDAYCWGTNLWGSLGIGPCRQCASSLSGAAGANRDVPVRVTVVAQPQDLAMAGGGHVCGLVAGTPECWGKSGESQLGIPQAQVITDGVDLAAGSARFGGGFSCAIRSGDGSVQCWGVGNEGQLGDGVASPTPRAAIGPVSLPLAAVQIDATTHACAVLVDGSVWCWGEALEGRVQPGVDMPAQPTPQRVIASGAVRVEVGRHTCAQIGDQVRCWGPNTMGALGDGTTGPRSTIATVLGP